MNFLVKILSSDDGEPRDKDQQFWHLVENTAGGNATLCEGEYFGEGESSCKFETKKVDQEGITCPYCIRKIKWLKKIKL